MELGNRLGLRKGDEFAPLWVIGFSTFRMGRRNRVFTQCTTLYFKPEDGLLENRTREKPEQTPYDMIEWKREIGPVVL